MEGAGQMTDWKEIIEKIQAGDQQTTEWAIRTLEPHMRKHLKYTSKTEQENLMQELRIKTFLVLTNFKFQETPGFWDWKKEQENEKNKRSG